MDIVEKPTSNRDRPAPPGQDSGISTTATSRANEKKTNFNAVRRRATTTTSKESHESACNLKDKNDEENAAPLGFEPEGSATRPSFCEGCSSLQGLLSDRYGYEVFHEYLRLQNSESLLDFWRSCEKFRQLAKARSGLALPTANATYAKYMHKKLQCGSLLDDSIRAKVKHKLNSGQPLNELMFDSAQEAIFSYINEYFYASFIRSDVYKGFVGDEAAKIPTKDRVSTARSARFTGKALPTLPEEKVFEGAASHGQWTSCDPAIRSIERQADGMKEGYVLQNLSKAAIAGMFCQPIPPVVSVNDSDVQSLSSDALTDDSKSTVTDFSDMTSKSVEKKKREQGFHAVPGFIPRTSRLPKDRKQLPPEEFARILIERLEKVQVEREQEERAATNLASLPREHFRESKKSILQEAADRHRQYQQAGQFGLGIPAQKLPESRYHINGNCSIISSSSHAGFVEQCPVSSAYYQNAEPIESPNGTWRGCVSDKNMLDNPQCAPLTNTKKQWESVGTIESAPDSGVCVEEDHNLRQNLNWIVQWIEQGEKEATQLSQQTTAYPKHTRTKHASGHAVLTDQGTANIQPIAQDPLMPPLPQPDSRNTLEEASRRLAQKNCRERRSKSHHKNRPGYVSSKSSQVTCPQFSGNAAGSGDYHQKCMYSSSSVLSSVPSTVNSNDSGLGPMQKKNKKQPETTRIVYYLGSEDTPFQSTLPGKVIVLGQFKHLVNFKKGQNSRYFFKRKSDEEVCGAVFEEITDDDAPLPCFNGKVTCKVKFV